MSKCLNSCIPGRIATCNFSAFLQHVVTSILKEASFHFQQKTDGGALHSCSAVFFGDGCRHHKARSATAVQFGLDVVGGVSQTQDAIDDSELVFLQVI